MAFERLKKAVRSWMQTTGADLGVAKEFKSIFELGGVPAFQQFYNFGIYPWKWLYRGYYEAWHLIPAPTVADPRAKRKMYYLCLSKAVCSELAGMVWSGVGILLVLVAIIGCIIMIAQSPTDATSTAFVIAVIEANVAFLAFLGVEITVLIKFDINGIRRFKKK